MSVGSSDVLGGTLQRFAAFTTDPRSGNPAGVWIGRSLPAVDAMQRLAAAVGFSETAFATLVLDQRLKVRYFSPEKEVPFCGHATIALGVALGDGTFVLDTSAGEVAVRVALEGDRRRATLTSVEPYVVEPPGPLVTEALDLLGWRWRDLDPGLPARIAFAGARHLLLAAGDHARLRRLDYDFDDLRSLMLDHDLTTVALVHRERPERFHARNAFPVGGVVEDPATGAAAAALGAYLRELGAIDPPAQITVLQGAEMGRPSELIVDVPSSGGPDVSGTAVPIGDT